MFLFYAIVLLFIVLFLFFKLNKKRKRTYSQSQDQDEFEFVFEELSPAELVDRLSYNSRNVLNRSEARLYWILLKKIRESKLNLILLAQVNLGEFISCDSPEGYRLINTKRTDFLIVNSAFQPIMSIEYQGAGHFQGNSQERDQIKKIVLGKIGVMIVNAYYSDLEGNKADQFIEESIINPLRELMNK